MNKKNIPWRSHIGMSKCAIFGPHEKELMMKLFEADLDWEIEHAKKSHQIQVMAKWRNLGCDWSANLKHSKQK